MHGILQDDNNKCTFMDTPLKTINGTTTTPQFIGGNMHNDCISCQDEVSLFKATEVTHMEMSYVGDYVSYRGEDEEVYTVALYANKPTIVPIIYR